MVNDFRMDTLSGLDEGLRVRHIVNFPLVTCKVGDDIEELFGRTDYKDFDQLPIMFTNNPIDWSWMVRR